MRLFLALRLPGAALERLGRLQCDLASSTPGWRWIPSGKLHLTIRFLGHTDETLQSAAQPAWTAAARACAPFRLRSRGLGCFPPRGRPRVLFVGVADEPVGELARLQERIERACRGVGFDPEQRPFRAHLTLARAARQARPARPPVDPPTFDLSVKVHELTLFRSELHPSGPRYTVRASFPLAGGTAKDLPPVTSDAG